MKCEVNVTYPLDFRRKDIIQRSEANIKRVSLKSSQSGDKKPEQRNQAQWCLFSFSQIVDLTFSIKKTKNIEMSDKNPNPK